MSSKDAAGLRHFVNVLPRIDRYILLMFYADDLTPAEISQVLDLPEYKVEQRLTVLRDEVAAALHAGAQHDVPVSAEAVEVG